MDRAKEKSLIATSSEYSIDQEKVEEKENYIFVATMEKMHKYRER